MMLGAVDTIMLSQYSDESVAAVGVVNQIVMFAFLVFEVINIGTSVLCSQYLGARMQKNMIQVVGVSLLLNLVVGVLISIILHFGATTLLGWMGLRPELLKYGIGYMEIVGAFAFFQAISLTISALLQRAVNKASGVLKCQCRTIMVGYDVASKEPVELPADFKRAICDYEGKTLEELSQPLK